ASIIATGKIDTAARWSAIPEYAVKELVLQRARDIKVYDFNYDESIRPSYYVRLEIQGLTNKIVEVITRKRSDVLVGCDILTDLKLISSPSENFLSLEKPRSYN
ncbi:MAG: hypothetical protein ACHQ03_12225, partial [Candidatus Bathyarchaeia archaeon]